MISELDKIKMKEDKEEQEGKGKMEMSVAQEEGKERNRGNGCIGIASGGSRILRSWDHNVKASNLFLNKNNIEKNQ